MSSQWYVMGNSHIRLPRLIMTRTASIMNVSNTQLSLHTLPLLRHHYLAALEHRYRWIAILMVHRLGQKCKYIIGMVKNTLREADVRTSSVL